MYRRIVLAYDGTRAGREALRQGSDLAVLCKAQVYLLAVVAPGLGVTLAEAAAPSDLPEREGEEVRRVLMEGAEELRRAGLAVETRLGRGSPAEEIGRVAHEVAADLIVVGHGEQSALARWYEAPSALRCSPMRQAACWWPSRTRRPRDDRNKIKTSSGEERASVARRRAARRRVAVIQDLHRLSVGVRPAVARKLRLACSALGRVAQGFAGANEWTAECGLWNEVDEVRALPKDATVRRQLRTRARCEHDLEAVAELDENIGPAISERGQL